MYNWSHLGDTNDRCVGTWYQYWDLSTSKYNYLLSYLDNYVKTYLMVILDFHYKQFIQAIQAETL